MDARSLLLTFDALALLSLVAWMGILLYQALAVLPKIGMSSGPDPAEGRARAQLVRSSAWGSIAGAIALGAIVSGPLTTPELRGPRIGVQSIMIIIGALISLYTGNALPVAIDAARAEGSAGHRRLARLRRRGFALHGIGLAIGIGVLVAFATRPTPKTPGIIEPSPIERARQAERRLLRSRDQVDPPSAGRPGEGEPSPVPMLPSASPRRASPPFEAGRKPGG